MIKWDTFIISNIDDFTFGIFSFEADNWPNVISIFQAFQNGGFAWDIGMVDLPIAFELNRWYRAKLEVQGSQANIWIDDSLMAQADWRNIAVLPESGKIGLGGGGGELRFDNFVITGDEVPNYAIGSTGKLTTTWGQIRSW